MVIARKIKYLRLNAVAANIYIKYHEIWLTVQKKALIADSRPVFKLFH